MKAERRGKGRIKESEKKENRRGGRKGKRRRWGLRDERNKRSH